MAGAARAAYFKLGPEPSIPFETLPENVKAPWLRVAEAVIQARGTGLDPEMGFFLEAANAGELAAYDHAVMEHCAATLKILDGKATTGGSSNEPWASVRKRLVELVREKPASKPVNFAHDDLDGQLAEIDRRKVANLPNLPKAYRVEQPRNSESYGLFTAGQMVEYGRAVLAATPAPTLTDEQIKQMAEAYGLPLGAAKDFTRDLLAASK